jgi:hypothetical protein
MLSIRRDQCIIKSNQVANTGGGHHRIISRLFRWKATHYKDELHFWTLLYTGTELAGTWFCAKHDLACPLHEWISHSSFRSLHVLLQIPGVSIIKQGKFPGLLTSELTRHHYIRRLKNRIRFFQFAGNCLKGAFHNNWFRLNNIIKSQSFLLFEFKNENSATKKFRKSWDSKAHCI